MDLRQLEIIRAIADTGSFTAAGEKLHVSQSAISRQILLLEEELGEAVFHRIGRRIRITPAGESLLQLSHRVFQDLQDTVAAISDTQESLRGTHAPGRRHDGLPLRLPDAARRGAAHPPEPRSEGHGRQRRALDRHAAVRRGRPGSGDAAGRGHAISCRCRCFQEELLLVTYPTHPLAKKRQITPADLNKQPFILFESRVDHAAPRRRVLHTRAHRAAHRDGDRERRDHQGDGAQRSRHQHRSRGRRPRPTCAAEAAVLQPDRRPLADRGRPAGSIRR